jgi:hypothetical protein
MKYKHLIKVQSYFATSFVTLWCTFMLDTSWEMFASELTNGYSMKLAVFATPTLVVLVALFVVLQYAARIACKEFVYWMLPNGDDI